MFSTVRRSSLKLQSTIERVVQRNYNSFSRFHSKKNVLLRRALPIGLGLSLATGCIALSEPLQTRPLNVAEVADIVWTRWTKPVLSKTETRGMYRVILKLAPKRDIFKNIVWIIPLYKAKCNVDKESMTVDQFKRWIEFYTDENYSEAQWKTMLSAFDLDSTGRVSLNEFISVYVLIQTMEKKNIKKRDLFKWSKANFDAMDIDSSGYLDFDEVVYWIEFLIRAGYVNNQASDSIFLNAEELGDMSLRKYDSNFDGKISFDEFRGMFGDLLEGTFADTSSPSDVLLSN